MYIWTCGTIVTTRPLTNELKEKIAGIFADCDIWFETDSNSFTLNELYGDWNNELDELANLMNRARIGVDTEKTSLTYYGDYEGGYVWENGRFESYDGSEYAIRSAGTQTLLAELERRGAIPSNRKGTIQ